MISKNLYNMLTDVYIFGLKLDNYPYFYISKSEFSCNTFMGVMSYKKGDEKYNYIYKRIKR